ncbi:MAG: two-component regulator propeller domain-containing protein [Segetibacter sp.]
MTKKDLNFPNESYLLPMCVRKAIIAILLFVFSFVITVFSQYTIPKAFKILNVADGLPQSFISGMVQDSSGFIWIGTRDGLARYDGKKFKIFRHIPGDTTTLSDNIISLLYLDKLSRLWIYYEAGDMDVLNTETETIFHFSKYPVYKSVYSRMINIYSINDDAKGNFWIYSREGWRFAI